jgi:hypothetical protein
MEEEARRKNYLRYLQEQDKIEDIENENKEKFIKENEKSRIQYEINKNSAAHNVTLPTEYVVVVQNVVGNFEKLLAMVESDLKGLNKLSENKQSNNSNKSEKQYVKKDLVNKNDSNNELSRETVVNTRNQISNAANVLQNSLRNNDMISNTNMFDNINRGLIELCNRRSQNQYQSIISFYTDLSVFLISFNAIFRHSIFSRVSSDTNAEPFNLFYQRNSNDEHDLNL